MKFGLEFEFFVSNNGVIVPAYLATTNLDGNPFLGEIKTQPLDNIVDTIFELEKLIYLEQQKLIAKGYKMEIIPCHQFTIDQLVDFRKNRYAVNKKELEVLEEFSIYSNNKTGKILKKGETKASLQVNISEHKTFNYLEYNKISVDDKHKYESSNVVKHYSCVFNYLSILQKLDNSFSTDISTTKRTKGVYAIKEGIFGDRIEYRSLPNTIDYKKLITLL